MYSQCGSEMTAVTTTSTIVAFTGLSTSPVRQHQQEGSNNKNHNNNNQVDSPAIPAVYSNHDDHYNHSHHNIAVAAKQQGSKTAVPAAALAFAGIRAIPGTEYARIRIITIIRMTAANITSSSSTSAMIALTILR